MLRRITLFFPGSLATAPAVILRYRTVGEDSEANNTVILATLICEVIEPGSPCR